MPSEKYFTLAEKFYLRVIDEKAGTAENYTDYGSTIRFVSDLLPHFNQSLMTNAEAFHASLYQNGLHISSLTDSYYLYGTGVDTRTMYNCFKIKNEDPMTYGKDYTYRVNYELPADDDNVFLKLEGKLGDSLVAQWSAALGGASVYNDKIYCCPKNYHMDIIRNNGNVWAFMRKTILGTYVYQEEDNFKNGYGFIDFSWVDK